MTQSPSPWSRIDQVFGECPRQTIQVSSGRSELWRALLGGHLGNLRLLRLESTRLLGRGSSLKTAERRRPLRSESSVLRSTLRSGRSLHGLTGALQSRLVGRSQETSAIGAGVVNELPLIIFFFFVE